MIKRVFRQMLLTQILSAMTVTLCMLIDSMMIGRFLGVDAMSAYGLASPVLLVFAALGAMISAGIQVVCGKTMGSGDEKGTDTCFTVSILLAVGISVLALVLVFTVPDQLCTFLGAGSATAENVVFRLTKDYLTGFIAGAPAFIFAQIMVPYVQMAGEQNRLIVAVAFMTVADIVLDFLNVFAVNGGMFGMGIASSLSYYVAVAIGITYFFSKKCLFRFWLGGTNGKVCLNLLRNGIPTVINQISLVLLVYVFNRILLDVEGNLGVAAYSVISTVSSICYSFGSGVAAVSLTLSSVFYVDEDRTSLLKLMKIMVVYAIVLDVIVTLAVLFTAPVLVGIFLTEPDAREMAVLGVRLFSLSLVPCSLNTSLKNFYQGTSRTGFTEIISVLQNFVLGAVFALVLSRFTGATGVWLAYVCAETMMLLLISCVVWYRNRRVDVSVRAYALISSDLGVPEEDCFEMTIHNREEANEASKAAYAFCEEHGTESKVSMYVSLCIEEILNNIVKYGFGGDKREHSVNIRYMEKNGERVLRFRDDCKRFDPVSYLELHKSDTPDKHSGIRMVMAMVKDAGYINSLGLNNLTLVF